MTTPKKDLPDFASWSHKNLADFAAQAYVRMQEQDDALQQERLNTKAALLAVRKLIVETSK